MDGILIQYTLSNSPCSDSLRAVSVSYLLGQALMKCRRFGACRVYCLPKADETGHTSQRDDVAMIPLDHVWQELFDGPEVR